MVPNVGWRPLRFWLSIATAPVTTQARPTSTCTATIVRKAGELEGISIPSRFVVSFDMRPYLARGLGEVKLEPSGITVTRRSSTAMRSGSSRSELHGDVPNASADAGRSRSTYPDHDPPIA